MFSRPPDPRRSRALVARLRSATFLAIAALAAFATSAVRGATSAGTVLTNRATVQSAGNSAVSNSLRIVVAQVAAAALSAPSGQAVAAPGQTVSLAFSLTNQGNGADAFSLTVASASGWISTLYRDDNGDGLRQPTETTVVSSSGRLAAGGTFRFLAVVVIPATAASGTQSSLTVTGRSTFSPSAVASAACSLRVQQSALFTLAPSAAAKDGVPGTTVFFAAALSNNGSGTDSCALSVTCPQGWTTMLYRDDNGDGVRQNTETTVVSTSGSLSPGSVYRLFVAIAVPTGASVGTRGVATLTATPASAGSTGSVGTYTATARSGAGVAIGPESALVNARPGAKAYIPFTVTNRGTVQDSFLLSLKCDLTWVVRVVADSNQDGVHQSSETTAISSAGPLAAGGQTRAFVEVSVPGGLTTQVKATTFLSATSRVDATKTSQVSYSAVAEVVLPGDVDGDGSLTAADAARAADMAVGDGSWTPAQRAAADVTRDGMVDVQDVMQLLNLTRAEPFPVQATTLPGREVRLPTFTAEAGARAEVDVAIDEGAAVAAFQAQIALDTGLLQVIEVAPGRLMGSDRDWQIVWRVDSGRLRVLAYNAAGRSLRWGSGAVLRLRCEVPATASRGAATVLGWNRAIVTDAAGAAYAPISYWNGWLDVK